MGGFDFAAEKFGARYRRFLNLYKFAFKRAVLANTLGCVLLIPLLFLMPSIDLEHALFAVLLTPVVGSLIALTGSWMLALFLRSRWLEHWYTVDLCPMANLKWDLLCGVITIVPCAGTVTYMALPNTPLWAILAFPSILGVPVAGAVVLSLIRTVAGVVKETTHALSASTSTPHMERK